MIVLATRRTRREQAPLRRPGASLLAAPRLARLHHGSRLAVTTPFSIGAACQDSMARDRSVPLWQNGKCLPQPALASLVTGAETRAIGTPPETAWNE